MNRNDKLRYIGKVSLALVVTAGMSGIMYADNLISKEAAQTNSGNMISQFPQRINPFLTQSQLETVRSFLTNEVNRIPNLNLTEPQINAILTYFDQDPTAIPVNLAPQQIEVLRSFILNNYNQIAGLRLSREDLTTVLQIILTNAQGISNLVTINPEIAALIQSLAPQINQLSTLNPSLSTVITILRTRIPVINSLLT